MIYELFADFVHLAVPKFNFYILLVARTLVEQDQQHAELKKDLKKQGRQRARPRNIRVERSIRSSREGLGAKQ